MLTRGFGLRVIALLLLLSFASLCSVAQADRLVLRDLTILRDTTVKQMTVDGLQLADGKLLTWDQVESGRLDGGRQALFDRYLTNLGDDLYRIRRRMNTGDYAGLLPHAENLDRFYRNRRSDTAYLVQQGLMWGRLATGQREAAAAPYLRCLETVRQRGADAIKLPGERRLKFDAKTGLSLELPPVWFNQEAAKTAMPEVLAAVGEMKQPRPAAARVYYTSLAVAAQEHAAASRVIVGLDTAQLPVGQIKQILLAQQEILSDTPGEQLQTLQTEFDHYGPLTRPLALYWVGLSRLGSEQSETQKQGMLNLLQLPAVYAAGQPDLSAAGLYAVMKSMEAAGDTRGSLALRGELLSKYSQTYHAALLEDRLNKEPKE